MQALRTVAATRRAIELGSGGADLTAADVCDIHATLMGPADPIAGRIRDRQNWVGGGALGSPLRARHVGPPPEFVSGLLDDLVALDDITSPTGDTPKRPTCPARAAAPRAAPAELSVDIDQAAVGKLSGRKIFEACARIFGIAFARVSHGTSHIPTDMEIFHGHSSSQEL